ncbi:hypothetical protein CYANOKiyG1_30490 [Okeania sp. KiyG1]|nr:hypothetical protein CYANOKiyG1_30490 [Okeania sp. KiyG1]
MGGIACGIISPLTKGVWGDRLWNYLPLTKRGMGGIACRISSPLTKGVWGDRL